MPTDEGHTTAPRGSRTQDVERLVDAYADLVLRLAYTQLGSTYDAQDVCQTVFLRLLELFDNGLAHFTDGEHEKAWIIRTTVNACRDAHKSAWRRKVVSLEEGRPEEPSAGDGPEAALVTDEGDRAVLSAVNELPESYRQAVYLHYYEGYSVKDIAALTGEKPATVSAHLSRARAKLRGMLEGECL